MASKAVWKLISMFGYAHFIAPCTPFYSKATESKVEPQLNSNGDAIKCKKAEGEFYYGDVYALDCVTEKTFDCIPEVTVGLNVIGNLLNTRDEPETG